MSVHSTACRMQGKDGYDNVMKDKVLRLRRTEKGMDLSDEEKEWMLEHRQYVEPLDWLSWKTRFRREASNGDQMMLLRRLNSGKRRTELRMVNGDRTSRIQSEADAGRPGGVIRRITGLKQGFKMESLVVGDELVVDGAEISGHVNGKFKEWFHRPPVEKARDEKLAGLMGNGTGLGWDEFAKEQRYLTKRWLSR